MDNEKITYGRCCDCEANLKTNDPHEWFDISIKCPRCGSSMKYCTSDLSFLETPLVISNKESTSLSLDEPEIEEEIEDERYLPWYRRGQYA